jgi:hypothetical protein
MAVREDCRHYSTRTVSSGEVVQRCRVDANDKAPFACPDHCIFFEPRSITDTGWRRFDAGEQPGEGPPRSDPPESDR